MFPHRHLGIHPKSRLRVLYFEVRVYRGIFGIGLAPENYSTIGVGWNSPSIGYHADNGMIYGVKGHTFRGYRHYDIVEESNMLKSLSNWVYCGGNVIGCGIDFNKRKFFFTKNGTIHPHEAKMKEHYPKKIFYSDTNINKTETQDDDEEEQSDDDLGLERLKEDFKDFDEERELFPSIGAFPTLSPKNAISFDINLGEDTIRKPFMFEELNHKEDLLYTQDKQDRHDFVVLNFSNFTIMQDRSQPIQVFKCLLLS